MAHLEAIQVSLEKVTVNFRPGPRAFASVIYDDAWADKIEKGDVVVIDPDAFRVAPFLACIELKIFNKYIRTVRELQSRGADQFELIPKGGKRFASFLVNVTELTQNVSILGPIVKVIKSL